MCGKTSQSLIKVEIEGVVMNVCSFCSKFGKVIATPSKQEQKKLEIKKLTPKPPQEIEITQKIKDNFAEIIRKKREQLGLKQEELAKMLAEKVSLLAKIEQGNIKPSLELAKKLEKRLNISIIEDIEQTKIVSSNEKTDTVTLGDIVKIKKK